MQIFAATYTPLKEDLSLKLDIIGQYANYLTHNKINGVFINGSTGDFASLTISERKEHLEAWVPEKTGLTLINHVGDIGLKNAMDLAAHSAGKADAIAAIAPFYFRPSNIDQLIEYCSKIAASAPNLPFYYYHLPALTNVNFDITDFLKKAVDQIPSFEGIKFTQNDLVAYQEVNAMAGDKDIFFGVDEAFLPSLATGAKGWVGSTFNHLTPLYRAIADHFYECDFYEARKLQALALKFVQTLASYGGFNGGGKSFMKEMGVDCGPSRFPHRTLNSEEIKEVLSVFTQYGLNEYLNRKVENQI
ncbi:dihydrodipicolinate synthase family protein [Gramella sp. AN32]|uniref:Dihydrodipicolinate synthase family protein n=1 Tax=Christiangramia antarctica TaxID=2058158 RepID=A0ABW5X1F8_9FLAO|nr:dihydrodipicolinate synthase family protein [Gramella sp. AN32]MCM4156990.1 N-acetylneuraminate lyase [Gramella sp. AN32]